MYVTVINKLTAVKIKIDKGDLELFKLYHWTPTVKILANGSKYIQVSAEHNNKTIHLGRFLLDAKPGYEVDHKDGDTTNYHRRNLREITRAQNAMNKGKGKGTSKYKGVSWDFDRNKWVVHTNNKHVGRFTSEIEAAKAYNKAAIIAFGEFARLNVIS